MSFSTNAGAYRSKPIFASHSAICCIGAPCRFTGNRQSLEPSSSDNAVVAAVWPHHSTPYDGSCCQRGEQLFRDRRPELQVLFDRGIADRHVNQGTILKPRDELIVVDR